MSNGHWATVIIGLAMIVGGIGVSVWSYNAAEGGGTYIVLWGLPIAGAFMVVRALWNRGKNNGHDNQCRFETTEGANPLPVVLVPIDKVAEKFGGRIPETLGQDANQQQMVADIITADVIRNGRWHSDQSRQDAWTIAKWLQLQVLTDDSGQPNYLAIVYDDGRLQQETG